MKVRAVVALLAVLLVGAPRAAAIKPSVLSVSVKPSVLPPSGGAFTVVAHVRHAHKCTLYFYLAKYSVTADCSSGRITFKRRAPANSSTEPLVLWITIEAHGRPAWVNGTGEGRLEVRPNAPPPPRVRGLNICTPAPDCFYGSSYESFPSWGNVPPEPLGDCTFAAAANWEQILLGVHANPTLIGYEFAQAGGSAERGLSQNALWSYWQRYGIAGHRLTGLHRYFTDKTDVENGVRAYAAMIVAFAFGNGDYFGTYLMPTTTHDAIVDGFTPEGPLVTTWGETIQLTWEQWSVEAVGMWGIGTT